jgi:hypothetical protein
VSRRGLLRALVSALFGKRHLALRMTLGKRFEVAFWERPGLWCADAELDSIVADMRAVAAEGQRGKPVPHYGALVGDRRDLGRRIITIAYDREHRRPAGFNALAALDLKLGVTKETLLHLGLTYVDPRYQGQSLPALLYGATAFLMLFKGGLRGCWISNVTQVPAVLGLVAAGYSSVYPNPLKPTPQTFAHLTLARQIMRHHRSAFGVADDAPFDEARQVILDAYTGGSDELKKTFEEAPKHRDPRVNDFCKKALDYARGDDFLQLGRCDLPAAVRFLGSKLPRGAVPQLLYRAAVLLFFATLLPALRWVIPEGRTES